MGAISGSVADAANAPVDSTALDPHLFGEGVGPHPSLDPGPGEGYSLTKIIKNAVTAVSTDGDDPGGITMPTATR